MQSKNLRFLPKFWEKSRKSSKSINDFFGIDLNKIDVVSIIIFGANDFERNSTLDFLAHLLSKYFDKMTCVL